MTPLGELIRAMIEADGPMPVSRYFALCLGHPQHGYYMTRDPLGVTGDFTTAPEVSQMFGELIGVWCVEAWRRMGQPQPIHLVELGPGRGTLMLDLLRSAKAVSDLPSALHLQLVEISPNLRQLQYGALRASGVPIDWHEAPDTLPDGPLIVIANEFVDALPVDQFVKTADGWHERRVGFDAEGRLAFGLHPTPVPKFEVTLPARLKPAPEGALVERRALGPVVEIANRISAFGGAGLAIDYGHANTGFGDTLQGVRAHAYVDPLAEPGQADLTAQVDFEALVGMLRVRGLRIHGPALQGMFMRRLGIEVRARRLQENAEPHQRAAISAALARLVDPAPGMGELFKVLCFTHRDVASPPGFDIGDRRGQP